MMLQLGEVVEWIRPAEPTRVDQLTKMSPTWVPRRKGFVEQRVLAVTDGRQFPMKLKTGKKWGEEDEAFVNRLWTTGV